MEYRFPQTPAAAAPAAADPEPYPLELSNAVCPPVI